jgi:predicted metalloprotease with PDZ domain
MEIMKSTNGEKSLDDVMRNMYNRYYKQLNRGFTEAEFKAAVAQVAGHNMDAFFRDYVNGTKSPDYSDYFTAAGLKMVNLNAGSNMGSWGANTTFSDGRVIVSSVSKGSSAYEGGVNVKDEIIAVNGYRVANDLDRYVTGVMPGEELEVLIARDGILQVLQIKVLKDTRSRLKFEKVQNPTAEQVKIYNKWLGIAGS